MFSCALFPVNLYADHAEFAESHQMTLFKKLLKNKNLQFRIHSNIKEEEQIDNGIDKSLSDIFPDGLVGLQSGDKAQVSL